MNVSGLSGSGEKVASRFSNLFGRDYFSFMGSWDLFVAYLSEWCFFFLCSSRVAAEVLFLSYWRDSWARARLWISFVIFLSGARDWEVNLISGSFEVGLIVGLEAFLQLEEVVLNLTYSRSCFCWASFSWFLFWSETLRFMKDVVNWGCTFGLEIIPSASLNVFNSSFNVLSFYLFMVNSASYSLNIGIISSPT